VVWILLAELVAVAVLVVGIGLLSVPVALIVAGVLAVVALERASAQRTGQQSADDLARRRGRAA
jgi:ABC-type transport system involved in cytochrome bd biosynthesis fused ATPase/permease subunit